MGSFTIFQMFENPRRGRQARNFTTNVPKILDLKSSFEQIFFQKLSLGAPVQRPLLRFRSEEYFVYKISREMFYPNLQRFVWRCHAGTQPDGHRHGGWKPTETSVTEFCYKSMNYCSRNSRNIKVILFLIHKLFR